MIMGANANYSSKLTWNGPRIAKKTKAAGRKGVRAAGEYLKSKAVPLAPKDTGALRNSATVKGVNAEPIVEVIFDTPYAVIQHENEEYHHDDGQAKYLEKPLIEERGTMMQIMAQTIRNEGIGNA